MSITNVSTLYKRIHNGSEGGGEFARIINLLLIAEAKQKNWKIINFNDAAGDYKGLDLVIIKEGNIHEGFQYKFYPSPYSSNHKTLIKASIEKALGNYKYLHSITIITPEDIFKHEIDWFSELGNSYGKYFGGRIGYWSSQPFIEHLGHTKLIELFLRHPHIGKPYYPELFNYNIEQFKLVLSRFNSQQLLLDVAFQNNTISPVILSGIEFVKLEEWSSMSGIPNKYLLKIVGQIKLKVNLKKDTNNFDLRNPIIIPPRNPIRFNIQLLNFIETMRGSGVEFKLRFYFNNKEFFIESAPYTVNR